MTAAIPSQSLFQRALKGSVLTAGAYAVTQALRLLSNLILTRLLFPEAFGLNEGVSVPALPEPWEIWSAQRGAGLRPA